MLTSVSLLSVRLVCVSVCCCTTGWDSDWGATVKPTAVGGGSKLGGGSGKAAPAAGAAAGGAGVGVGVGGLNRQHSLSSPTLHNKEEDDWGKW